MEERKPAVKDRGFVRMRELDIECIRQLRLNLEHLGIQVEAGLSRADFDRLEDVHSIIFPPDLRDLLVEFVPVSPSFPSWRGNSEEVRRALELPADGVLFDVLHNAFWLSDWGSRPAENDQAARIARQHLTDAPRLLPIFSHRYLPSAPSQAGNPVFSVMQADVVIYGQDLTDYFNIEFRLGCIREERRPRFISFWSSLAHPSAVEP